MWPLRVSAQQSGQDLAHRVPRWVAPRESVTQTVSPVRFVQGMPRTGIYRREEFPHRMAICCRVGMTLCRSWRQSLSDWKVDVHRFRERRPAVRPVLSQATNTIPIVMAYSALDPVQAAASLQAWPHPGGNTTGLAEFPGLKVVLQMPMVAVVPNLTRIGTVSIDGTGIRRRSWWPRYRRGNQWSCASFRGRLQIRKNWRTRFRRWANERVERPSYYQTHISIRSRPCELRSSQC